MVKRKLDQKVHRELLFRHAQEFRDHKKGIPEWIKNSDDSYCRFEDKGISMEKRPIIINFSEKEVFCLDFGGTEGKIMERFIPYWGDPQASKQGSDSKKLETSGGHGNGGKYYGLAQFKECQISSYFQGKLTIMRIDKSGEYIDLFEQKISPYEALKSVSLLDVEYFGGSKHVPLGNAGKESIEKVLEGEIGFFIWRGIEPKDSKVLIDRRKLIKIISPISNHPQCRSALRSRRVDILHNGILLIPNLSPEEVIEDSTFGSREFTLPDKLGDYEFNKEIDSKLIVTLSAERLVAEKTVLNILEINANGRNIAHYKIPSLMLSKGVAKDLFAKIDCPELREYDCVSNDRVNLNPNEITDLFLNWCKEKIQDVIDELSDKEKQKQNEKNLEELGNFLKEITNEISDLLQEDVLNLKYKKDSKITSKVDVPSDNQGYGQDGKIKKKGGGKRKGGTELKEGEVDPKKKRSQIKILLTDHDKDPLSSEGKSFSLLPREPLLYQRTEDVDHGIWWVNSSKDYVKKIKIRDPGSKPFYFFLVKEIIFTHRLRQRFREQDMYEPEGLEELNFELINDIFSRIVGKLGIELEFKNNFTEMILDYIRDKDKFFPLELSKELDIPISSVHTILQQLEEVKENFSKGKGLHEDHKGEINLYIRNNS